MSYQLVHSLTVTANNGTQLIQGLDKTELLIEATTSGMFQNGDLIERAYRTGRRFGFRWIQGASRGQINPLEYGSNEVLLDVPNPLTLFDIELIPNRYQFEYEVKIYVKTFNPRFNVLAERLGITLELLQAFPEQTLLFLEGLDLMANADTRQMIASIENAALKADQALQGVTDNASAISTVEGTLISAQAEMVVSSDFSLESADFLLENGYRVATVTHELKPGTLQMSLTDNAGDEQGFSQLIGNSATSPDKAKVELTIAQWEGSDFPFTLIVQGLKPVMGVAAIYRLIGGLLTSSDDGGSTTIQLASFVEYAYLLSGKVWYKRQDQSAWSFEPATNVTKTELMADFDANAVNPLATVIA